MLRDNRCLPQAGSGYFLIALFSYDTLQAVNLCRIFAACLPISRARQESKPKNQLKSLNFPMKLSFYSVLGGVMT